MLQYSFNNTIIVNVVKSGTIIFKYLKHSYKIVDDMMQATKHESNSGRPKFT